MPGLDHAKLMDGEYRFQRHIYDLTRKFYLLGRDRMLDQMRIPPKASVLEIGCGTGRNLIRAAKRYPNARYYGIDISDEMLKTAQTNINRAGLSKKIILARGDATAFSPENLFGQSQFDRVFISYALSMIPDWQGTIQHASRVLDEAGSLHIVDFGQQRQMPKWFKSLLFAWLRKFHVTPRASLSDFLIKVAATNNASAHFESILRDYAVLGSLKVGTQ